MRNRGVLVVVVLLALVSRAVGQVPAVPPAPAVAPAAPAPGGLLGLMQACKDCCADCKDKCCKSPLGQILNNMTKPLTFATGGLVPPICPPVPSDADLKKLLDPDSTASDAEKTAAAIKADEAKAAQRRAAIRYLGTVDCHYYPEAEDALISGLRGDRNECVRFEAALALSKGCCCTKKTMSALLIVVNGSDSDGKPSETSERVKEMAAHALQLCTCRAADTYREPTPPERPMEPPEIPKDGVAQKIGTPQTAAYFTRQAAGQSKAQLIDQASRYLAENISTTPATRQLPSDQRNVAGLIATLGGPTPSSADDNRAFTEALLVPPALRAPPPAPPVPTQVEPPRPVGLTAPSAVLSPR
jgi:hypothetical protein